MPFRCGQDLILVTSCMHGNTDRILLDENIYVDQLFQASGHFRLSDFRLGSQRCAASDKGVFPHVSDPLQDVTKQTREKNVKPRNLHESNFNNLEHR
jgi:hypothetical protein